LDFIALKLKQITGKRLKNKIKKLHAFVIDIAFHTITKKIKI